MRPLDFPDHALFSGTLESGAVAQVMFAVVPFNPPPARIEVFGREGTLVLTGQALHQGPNTLLGSQGKEPLAELEVPERFYAISKDTPRGPAFNVGQTYALEATGEAAPDFGVALERHRLLEAIQRSSDEGKRIKLSEVV
jgi:predicted dehydrogenase